LRQDVAIANGGFYSASEFEIEGLIAKHPDKRFMELGRSCVLPEYAPSAPSNFCGRATGPMR